MSSGIACWCWNGDTRPERRAKGSLLEYDFSVMIRSIEEILIDSLFRPRLCAAACFWREGEEVFVICEYGNNRGRLALYSPRFALPPGDSRSVAGCNPVRDTRHEGYGSPDIGLCRRRLTSESLYSRTMQGEVLAAAHPGAFPVYGR